MSVRPKKPKQEGSPDSSRGSRVAPWAANTGSDLVPLDQEGEGGEEASEVSEEVHRPRLLPTPVLPSAEEQEEHRVQGHVQYRTWCPHCVAARAVGQRHTAVREEPTAKPTILSDYAYMNGEGVGEASKESEATGAVESDNLPMLVLKDKKTKTFAASFVPEKGCNSYAIKFSRRSPRGWAASTL